jgi:hypothetical protein
MLQHIEGEQVFADCFNPSDAPLPLTTHPLMGQF